ncbi:MAG: hypothetical protein V1823_03525, partial [Chloroflexota bacterium]
TGNTGNKIYVSKNRGATWVERNAPGTARVQAIVLSDADTVHIIAGNRYYKSVNSGWTWTDSISASTGTASPWPSVNMLRTSSNAIIAGGKGGPAYMAATTFSQSTVGLTRTVNFVAAVDTDFAESTVIFAGGDDGSVWRRAHYADPLWVNIKGADSNPILDLQIKGGIMYALTANKVWRNDSYKDTASIALGAWQDMDKAALTTFPINLEHLVLSDDNIVWVANSVVGTATLWSYRDTLATTAPTLTGPADGVEISVDPNTGDGLPVLFTWNTLGTGAGVPTSFQLEIKEVGGVTTSSGAFGVNDITTPSISSSSAIGGVTFTFRANKEYEWRLRVTNTVSADTIRSVWSAARKIKVLSGTRVTQTQAGPILLGPQGGATTNLQPGFSWAPVPSATEYEFILATDAGLTQTVANTPVKVTKPSFQVTTNLNEDTTYFWAVRNTLPTVGDQAIGTFTTRAPAAPPVAPPPVAPPADIIVNVPDIVIPPAAPAAPAIDATLVWVVIGIGAILIIAVLVLIVRTRRPL